MRGPRALIYDLELAITMSTSNTNIARYTRLCRYGCCGIKDNCPLADNRHKQ